MVTTRACGDPGREKEAILISMVRSNDTGTVGFLSDSRHVCLAEAPSPPRHNLHACSSRSSACLGWSLMSGGTRLILMAGSSSARAKTAGWEGRDLSGRMLGTQAHECGCDACTAPRGRLLRFRDGGEGPLPAAPDRLLRAARRVLQRRGAGCYPTLNSRPCVCIEAPGRPQHKASAVHLRAQFLGTILPSSYSKPLFHHCSDDAATQVAWAKKRMIALVRSNVSVQLLLADLKRFQLHVALACIDEVRLSHLTMTYMGR